MPSHFASTTAAFISTGFISLAPNLLLFLFPNYSGSIESGGTADLQNGDVKFRNRVVADGSHTWLLLGQALAAGGLMGDVFLHTLPDCFAGSIHIHEQASHNGGLDKYDVSVKSEHDHENNHHRSEDIGLLVLLGFAVFLVTDILVRSFGNNSEHSHIHPNEAILTLNGNASHSAHAKPTNAPTAYRNSSHRSSLGLMLSSNILLNLFGDSLHNFTDGLAIGATFAASETTLPSACQLPSSLSYSSWIPCSISLLKSRGTLASASVFLHEIPHELGDFATLVHAGFSRNMAIATQFMTSVAAFMGTAIGLFSSELVEGLGHDVLLPFTAGGFIYLACVNILPEILHSPVGVKMRLLQIVFFALGIGFMLAVAELEVTEELERKGHVVSSELSREEL